jgi:hypothetical protein
MSDSVNRVGDSGRTLIIHGGMHKTGSSAIQEFLYEELDHPSVEYFSAGRANSSLVVLEAFHRRLGSLPRYKSAGYSPEELLARGDRARERFRKRLSATHKSTVVISAESFSLLNEEECTALKEEAGKLFTDVKLVLYIRPLRSRVESAFQEKLKKRFVNLDHKIVTNFNKRISTYDTVFGRSNVILRFYEPELFPEGSVVNDFLQLLDLDINVSHSSRANAGLSLPAVSLLYLYRRRYPVSIPEDKALIARLTDLKGDRFSMHPGLLDQILTEKDGDYRWLEQRAGSSLQDQASGDENGIRVEEELLRVPPDSLAWLRQQIEAHEIDALKSASPAAIAESMRSLALALSVTG